jgi:PhoH-like ATPase
MNNGIVDILGFKEVEKLIKKYDKIYSLDTNIILNDAHSIGEVSQNGKNLIVFAETVLDELDSKKSGLDEINFQSREFARLMQDSKLIGMHKGVNCTLIFTKLDDIDILIVSLKHYDTKDLDPKIINDRKIIQATSWLKDIFKLDNIKALSNDLMFRTRCLTLNIDSEMFVGSSFEDNVTNFYREINLDSSLFSSLENKDITEYDKEYKPHYYCYKFNSDDGNSLYAYIINKRINIIDEKLFDKVKVKPINSHQKFMMAGILDPRSDINVVQAKSGGGKTLISLSSAIRLVEKGQYQKIYYIRNSIESTDKGEDVGYLSGNAEKFAIYNHPLMDSLEFIARQSIKKKGNIPKEEVDEKINELITKNSIETVWVGEMRGRSFTSTPCIAIIDEAQNMSNKTLQTVMTRFGKDSKLIIIGSQNQIDNLYINKYSNGLSKLLKGMQKEPSEDIVLFGAELHKVVRGTIAEWAENLFTS